MAPKPDMRDHLIRQLGFLNRSCQSYDAGCSDEAVRIAVVLRVLFHDTKHSRSVLRQMKRRDIRLLSSCQPIRPNTVYFQGLGQTVIRASYEHSTTEFVPNLGPYPSAHLMPVEAWWQQLVMLMERKPIRRVQLVLAAANKDGGAHVDPSLTPEYESLAAVGALGRFEIKDAAGQRTSPVMDAHLVFLRQLGQEVLLSTELQALAAP